VLVLAVTLATPGPVAAHVAADRDVNNRYVKVTPLPGRVRLAYTILFGEVPGRAARIGLDVDGDGQLGQAETDLWAHGLAERVRAGMRWTFDGVVAPVLWQDVRVGLDRPEAAGGSFALDLVAHVCIPTARARHTVRLEDRFELPVPGETELRITEDPPVTIAGVKLAGLGLTGRSWTFERDASPLDEGLELSFRYDGPPLVDDLCGAPRVPPGDAPLGLLAAVGGAALAGLGLTLRRRRARRLAA
jgi:hypothetical protein